MFKRDDGVVVVHIYGKDVLAVDPSGAVRLNSEGDRGRNTFRAMNESLNKFGFKLTKSEFHAEMKKFKEKIFDKIYREGLDHTERMDRMEQTTSDNYETLMKKIEALEIDTKWKITDYE